MRILWITNILFPDICKELGLISPVMGGWMYSSAKVLIEASSKIQLAVASIYGGNELKSIKINDIIYYLLPNKIDRWEEYWAVINNDFSPHIVHLHGTELPYGAAYIRACGTERMVISIQGLVSICARYYYAGIDVSEILKHITLRDILRRDTIIQQKRKFEKRGFVEKDYILRANYVIGRTSWDKNHVKTINPTIQYFVCNETLRESFYHHAWAYEECKQHSIFLSQGSYPLKGLHQVIKALSLVLKKYPDTEVYVAGPDFINLSSFLQKLKRNGYSCYIKCLLNKYNLINRFHFLGNLSEEEMCLQYLKSNLFICPSSIENSPNSLGEAQLLGVPFLASNVGGIPDLVEDKERLYRFEEYEILAEKICDMFSRKENACSKKDMLTAALRHDAKKNANSLLQIYSEIYKNKSNE